MRILFLHPNFPAQFRHLAAAIAQDSRHQVVFGTTRREGRLPGVTKMIYSPKREARPETHHYVRPLENAVIQGQAVYRMAEQLKARGFVPDVVYGHSGWGPTLLMKDIFPKAKLLCYFEWFYHAHGTDADFDPNEPLTADDEARIRLKNAPILVDLYSCDRGLSPTYWQRQQFPLENHSKITVRHDGVDTNFFRPQPGAKLVLPRLNLDLSHVEELVTYVGRGMEPYRGFPQFIEAIYLLQQRRPQCHVVIVGEDRVAYGKSLPDGKTYKQLMLEKFPLDLSRVHFTGHLPYEEYLKVLQASSAHVYLTRPFVLSWSMLEALSTGCLVVGSSTAPVTEVIQDGVNGLLANFFSPEEIANRIEEALKDRDRMNQIRTKARQIIQERYDLSLLLPQHLQWIGQDMGDSQIPLWTPTQSKPANESNGKFEDQEPSSTPELVAIANSNESNRPLQQTNSLTGDPPIPQELLERSNRTYKKSKNLLTPAIAKGFGSNRPLQKLPSKAGDPPTPQELLEKSNQKRKDTKHSPTPAIANSLESNEQQPSVLQIGDRTVTGTELVSLLNQYQLLPKLKQEMLIEEAIAPFDCTPEEQAKCCQDFYEEYQLTSLAARQKWLQQQGMTEAQLINLATRQLRIEKFKQATWASKLETYFLKRKSQLDEFVYSLIRLQDADMAKEIYFRLQESEQSFPQLAEQYSQGPEARTGGLIGPVGLSNAHPKLAQLILNSEPGQLMPPTQIKDVWVIVRLEKFLPAQLDEPMRQRLLNELFASWLNEQLKAL
jgi:glycosyltransferase involved in cell wall biosynthesis/parvulin-like peptidyl-prolyl isomerase